MKARKIEAMHKRFGKDEAHKCRDCCHLISGDYRGRRYHKCNLYGMSRSEATDWRLSYAACGAYNVPDENVDIWTPILEQVVRERNVELPIDGQIEMEVK